MINLDLNEEEKKSFLKAISEIDLDFNEDFDVYNLKLSFIKNCEIEDITEIGWAGVMINASNSQNG